MSNLRGEGYRDDQIHLVGNVMVDTLLANLDRALRATLSGWASAGEYGLVTLHRPANVDDPAGPERLAGALGEVARMCPWCCQPIRGRPGSCGTSPRCG